MHNVRIFLNPEVNQLNFKTNPVTYSPHLRSIMMESENNWKNYEAGIETDEEGKGEIWS